MQALSPQQALLCTSQPRTACAASCSHSRRRPCRVAAAATGSACTPNMWHAQLCVGERQFPTELYGLQAHSGRPRVQVLVVPGNPGSAGFYRMLMQQVFAAFDGAADVMAVSHVGHDPDDISKGAVYGLDCQVQHKAQLCRELTAPGRPPLVILAHSIGAYIMLQALRQLEGRAGQHGANIAKVFLLMPFLTTDWSSWEQRVLAAAARQHGPRLAAAAGWVQNSPSFVQDRVCELMLPGAELHARESLRAALKQPSCLNNWHMAAQEFSVLDAPVDWDLIRRLGSKAAVVYNPNDPWFQQYEAMQHALPGIEAYADQGFSHAFCLSTAESRAVAQLVHASLTQGAAAPVNRPAGARVRPVPAPSSA